MTDSKLIKHAKEIASNNYDQQYVYGNRYFVNDWHRILEIDTIVEGLSRPMYNDARSFDNVLQVLRYEEINCPSLKEFKQKAYALAGRKKPIIWCDGTTAVNLRYLIAAMEGLNATKYFSTGNNTHPIFVFQNDNVKSHCKELILPTIKYNIHDQGFYIKNKNGTFELDKS